MYDLISVPRGHPAGPRRRMETSVLMPKMQNGLLIWGPDPGPKLAVLPMAFERCPIRPQTGLLDRFAGQPDTTRFNLVGGQGGAATFDKSATSPYFGPNGPQDRE